MKTRSRYTLGARTLAFVSGVLLTCTVATPALADDGAITNKDMSRTINLPDFGQDIVNNAVPEDEHAFTDMMGFYVPAQAASGEVLESIAYCDIDNTPAPGEDCTNAVEELTVAKPLVNVFIHGPKFAVPETAFGHSFMDTYAAVSLNDGENWKQTNLSNSAYQMTTENNPDTTRLEAIVSFLQNGDAELGVERLPDFNMEDDLYLLDAFGVLNIGETAIPGGPDRVAGLQNAGKRVMVVASIPRASRASRTVGSSAHGGSSRSVAMCIRMMPPSSFGNCNSRSMIFCELLYSDECSSATQSCESRVLPWRELHLTWRYPISRAQPRRMRFSSP